MNSIQYLQRIKVNGIESPTYSFLSKLQEQHLFTVPFENLDIHRGKKIVLEESQIYQKIVVRGFDPQKDELAVEYYGRTVCYGTSELDQITIAYAISVHKSQGSEYPAVIVPLVTQHYVLLQRNLLYTAMTRGKKMVILIGSPKALHIALNNDKPRLRLTSLAGRLA